MVAISQAKMPKPPTAKASHAPTCESNQHCQIFSERLHSSWQDNENDHADREATNACDFTQIRKRR